MDFELGDIGAPLLFGPGSFKISVEEIFCYPALLATVGDILFNPNNALYAQFP